jgi:hypothetical protein
MPLNFPVGTPREKNIRLDQKELATKLAGFSAESFTGCIALSAKAPFGIEDGILFFKEGLAAAASFEYSNYDIIVGGDKAMECFFNASAAKLGVFDIFELSKQQVDLIITLSAKIALSRQIRGKDLQPLLKEKYLLETAQSALGSAVQKEESKVQLLKKFGLGEIG